MQGGGDKDVIHGEARQDAVMGGRGNDVLYGGADVDRFFFRDDDVIPDFNIAEDRFVFISTELNSIADLTFSEIAGNAVIYHGTASITVEGVSDVDPRRAREATSVSPFRVDHVLQRLAGYPAAEVV